MAYAEAEKAAATRAAYGHGLAGLRRLVPRQGRHAAARPRRIVAAYLSHLASAGRKASTIGRKAAAIGYRHKIAGHEPPTNQEGVRAVLRGIRRTIGSATQGKAPATADLICDGSLLGRRDGHRSRSALPRRSGGRNSPSSTSLT